MEIIYKSIKDVKPYGKNPRKNLRAVDAVANSIKEFGFKVPIIIGGDGEIVAGHTRVMAAEKLGLEEVPCIVADDLSPEQIKAFRLADNKAAELAEWDFSLLENELHDIEINTDFSMGLFGFDEHGEKYDFSEFDSENESLKGKEEVLISISVPADFQEEVNDFLRNGEADTAIGRGKGVMRLCGLL